MSRCDKILYLIANDILLKRKIQCYLLGAATVTMMHTALFHFPPAS